MSEDELLEDDLAYDRYKPWSPKLFVGMMCVWTPLISGIGLALNWRGLGKPRWILPTLLLSIVVPIFALGLSFFVIDNIPANSFLLFFFEITFSGMMLGVIFGYVAALADFQQDAYHKWYRGKVEAMLKHYYELGPSLWKVLWWVIGLTLFAWLIAIIALLSL
jgi:hypothetical protein